jgi:hypothetical protein
MREEAIDLLIFEDGASAIHVADHETDFIFICAECSIVCSSHRREGRGCKLEAFD